MPHSPSSRLGALFIVLLTSRLAFGEWEPRESIGLAYPPPARMARISGIVIVRATIGEDGKVRNIETLSGHPLLARAAEANAGRWKFRRADREDTEPNFFLVYRFVLKGTCRPRRCQETFSIEFPNFVVVRSEIPQLETTTHPTLFGEASE